MEKIREDLKKRHITAIIGIRRSGKTTLYRILIKELLRTCDPERICYFSFDLAEEIKPRKLIKLYCEEVIEEPIEELSEKVYFFFDEIQKVDDWGNHVNYTRLKPAASMLIRGSNSESSMVRASSSMAPAMFCQKLSDSMDLSLYWDIPFTAMLIDALNSASSSSSHVEQLIRWKESS
ncbi:MAG: ATP-binding protein [Thermoplasmatota archaeon]